MLSSLSSPSSRMHSCTWRWLRHSGPRVPGAADRITIPHIVAFVCLFCHLCVCRRVCSEGGAEPNPIPNIVLLKTSKREIVCGTPVGGGRRRRQGVSVGPAPAVFTTCFSNRCGFNYSSDHRLLTGLPPGSSSHICPEAAC